jgi:N-acyl-D-aspartate/D-glutamate deacylase
MLWDPYFSPSTANGVSTLVIGNCSVGVAPCQPSMREYIMDICDAVENIPANASRDQLKWDWESFPEYLDMLEKRSFACDFGVLIGHTAVRTWVMGSRATLPDRPGGAKKNPVTTEEIKRMATVVEEAVAAGALGFSSSRVDVHRDNKGVLVPGSLSSPEELLALANGIVKGGGGVFELASDWSLYDDVAKRDPKELRRYWTNEWRWIEQLALMNPEKLSMTTGGGVSMDKKTVWDWGMMKQVDKIVAKGGNLMSTPMMRCGGLTFSIRSGTHPFWLSKTFKQLRKQAASESALFQLLAEPSNKAAIVSETRAEAKANPRHPAIGAFRVVLQDTLRLWPWSADPEPRLEDSVQQLAKREGTSSLDVCYDVLSRPHEKHGGVLMRYLYNYGNGDLEPLTVMLQHQKVVPGFADGGAHMANQCEAATPTSMLTHWCRDRSRGPKLPLELVVRKQTADSARMMGLSDRGELRTGMKADINVIDLDKLRVCVPEFKNDLPLGAGRWVQAVEGYQMTIVSGVVTYENGEPTGLLPGGLVKNPKSVGLQGSLRGSVLPAEATVEVDDVDMTEHALNAASRQGVGASALSRVVGKGEKDAPQSRL